jgi:two-component system response regulator AgrA
MLKVAALDDDPEILDKYKKQIPIWFSEHNIVGDLILATKDQNELMEEIERNTINVCILDISLRSDTNGLTLAKVIREKKFEIEIIFVTNCLDFIKQAFEVKAYQFIYKHCFDELETTLVQLATEKESQKQPYIKIKCNSEIFFVPISDINNIERLKNRTVVHSTKGEYVTYEGLEDIVNRIDDGRFKRCHRSVFVNSDKIYSIDLKRKVITLEDGTSCDIGPKFFPDFYNEGKEII